jgi:prepilin-type N-terminal cleavage/methylation domain-containing protein
MKKIKLHNQAFTLIEVIVSITIFSIMMISIIWIYITSSDITMKSDINRMMQENLKNVSNTIAEDIRKNGIM